jgi:hypothetical protein
MSMSLSRSIENVSTALRTRVGHVRHMTDELNRLNQESRLLVVESRALVWSSRSDPDFEPSIAHLEQVSYHPSKSRYKERASHTRLFAAKVLDEELRRQLLNLADHFERDAE